MTRIAARFVQGALAALLLSTALLPSMARPARAEGATTTWNALVLVYKHADVAYTQGGEAKRVVTKMTDSDRSRARAVVGRIPSSANELSDGSGAIRQTIVYPNRTIRSVTKLGEDNYWLSPSDIAADLDKYAPDGKYDSIIVNWRKHDGKGRSVPSYGWGWSIGPSGWSNGAGYSVVTTPENARRTWDGSHPEEIFVHEWMHQLEGFYRGKGADVPPLHDAEKLGYEPDSRGSWWAWYRDYLRGRVRDGDRSVGVSPGVWALGTPSRGAAAVAARNSTPKPGAMSPSGGTSYVGEQRTIAMSYSDADGWRNVSGAHASLRDASAHGRPTVRLFYDQNANKLWLRSQDGERWLGGYAPGSKRVIEAGHVRVNARASSVRGSGGTLSVRWALTFRSRADGAKYEAALRVRDDAGARGGKGEAGTRFVR